MTLDEFKAWLDGFEESFKANEDGIYPDGRQYAKIKGKLKEVSVNGSAPCTQPDKLPLPYDHFPKHHRFRPPNGPWTDDVEFYTEWLRENQINSLPTFEDRQ